MNNQLLDSAVPIFDLKEGFEVRDYADDTVGSVTSVRFSDDHPHTVQVESLAPAIAPDHAIVTALAETFTDVDTVPDEFRRLLLQKGYIRINRGLLQSDTFATLDQIGSVVNDVVYLNVMKDELFSF